MIDIDKVFDMEKNDDKKVIHGGITLSNPILYIFIGNDGTDALKDIYEFNQYKQLNDTEMVEYINIGTQISTYTNNNNVLISTFDEGNIIKKRKKIYDSFEKSSEILKIVSYIELKFLKHSYSIPIRRRIHFIVNAGNEYSCVIKKVICDINKFFISRNLLPIMDIFTLINDKPDNKECEKISTYSLLQELKEIGINQEYNINMIYVLSNLNSLRTLSNQKDIYTSIARTAIVKEFDYNQQLYDFSYNEGRIIDNVKNISKEKRGVFYSLGLKTIEKPIDILQFIALNTVIGRNDCVREDDINDFVSHTINDIYKIITDIYKRPLNNSDFMDNNNISSIMFNIKHIYDNAETNIDFIDNCFGKLLDKYFEYNSYDNLAFDENRISNYIVECFNKCILDLNIGYFVAVDILKNVQIKCEEIKESIEKTKYENEVKFENWKRNQPVIKKKSFDIFGTKYQFIFDIAREYIMYVYKIFSSSITLIAFENFENKMQELISITTILNKELQDSQKELILMAENKISINKDELIKNNFITYYSNHIKKFIEKNYEDYFNSVYSKIFYLTRQDVNLFYSECLKYIDGFILEAPEFNLTVYDEILSRLIDDGKGEYNEQVVNDLFNKEITDNKFYFIKLINENNFYSNICVLTDNSNIINKISGSDINYIIYNGDSKLEILYFIGIFNDESLAYNNIYKDAYLEELNCIEEN